MITDHKEYWNQRWTRDGYRGGISPYQQRDELWHDRNIRDYRRIRKMLGWTGQDTFAHGLEVGTGAGRLSEFLCAFVDVLEHVDQSEVAREHYKKSGMANRYEISKIRALADVFGKYMFDFAFTFTVVQHIHDHSEWEASLAGIQSILKPGGYYVMHEDITANLMQKQPAPHMNGFGLIDYEQALSDCERVNAEVLYYEPTKEYDLLAVWRKR